LDVITLIPLRISTLRFLAAPMPSCAEMAK